MTATRLPAEIGIIAIADATEQVNSGNDAFGLRAVDAQALALLRADGNIHGIEFVLQLSHGLGVDLRFEANFDTAHGENGVDVFIQTLARQAIRGDAVTQHAAEVLASLEDHYIVAHERKKISAGQTAGAAANHRNATVGLGRPRRHGGLVGRTGIDREFLNAANVDRSVEQATATTALARVLAHKRACGGQRVVFAHHVHGAGVIARRYKRDIGRHVHMRGAQRLARNLLLGAFGACTVFDVARVFIGMGFKTRQELGRGFIANSTVGGIANHFRQNTGAIEVGGRRLAVENAAHQRGKLGQAIAARHALAARLSRAGLEHGKLCRNGTSPRRRG